MSTAAHSKTEPRIRSVDVSDAAISATLEDGRVISIPLSWSWRIESATPDQRCRFEISPSWYGVHWPDIDEDISARGMLEGSPAPRRGRAKQAIR